MSGAVRDSIGGLFLRHQGQNFIQPLTTVSSPTLPEGRFSFFSTGCLDSLSRTALAQELLLQSLGPPRPDPARLSSESPLAFRPQRGPVPGPRRCGAVAADPPLVSVAPQSRPRSGCRPEPSLPPL